MEYMVTDLMEALMRARASGPKAEAAFRARIDAAFHRWQAGEPLEVAFFDLFADEPERRGNA